MNDESPITASAPVSDRAVFCALAAFVLPTVVAVIYLAVASAFPAVLYAVVLTLPVAILVALSGMAALIVLSPSRLGALSACFGGCVFLFVFFELAVYLSKLITPTAAQRPWMG